MYAFKLFSILCLFGLSIASCSTEEESFVEKNIEIINRGLCDDIDYVMVGVIPLGSPDMACQIATCAAWYDLENFYTTYTVASIGVSSETTFNVGNDDSYGTTTIPVVDPDGVNPKEKLTNNSYGDYLSYLSTLEDNFNGDPINDAYWSAFIACYSSIVNP